MGITLKKIADLQRCGVLPAGGRVLDIGSSNLYSATAIDINSFLDSYGIKASPELIEKLSAGSAYGPNGGLNESFVGELLELVGIKYLAFDIADGFKTKFFNLNNQSLAWKHRGAFDTVLNFGTTE